MRNAFCGYYRPSDEEFEILWESCIFSIDANVLLDLYRYSPESREELLKVLTCVNARLRITHQSALEYQFNRVEVINEQERVYENVDKILASTIANIESVFSRGHISIHAKDLIDKIKATFESVHSELLTQRGNHPPLLERDTFREEVTTLLDGRVGDKLPQERLNEIYEMGKKRYQHKIGPGFRDDKKGTKFFEGLTLEDQYGDLIIWFQLMEIARAEQRPIVFVSGDKKEDWWWKTNGRTLGPRPELMSEFREMTGQNFYMYPTDQFISFASKLYGLDVDEKVVEEVRDISESRDDWKKEVVEALIRLGGTGHLSEIYDQVEESSNRTLPESWKAIIRKTLQSYCSDTESYLGREDLFSRNGDGYWALKFMSMGETDRSISTKSTSARIGRAILEGRGSGRRDSEILSSLVDEGHRPDIIADAFRKLEQLRQPSDESR